MQKYQLLVSDVDGTLVDHHPEAMPSETTCSAIRGMIDRGYQFAIATGRPYDLVTPILEHIGIDAYCILDNGAAIIDSRTHEVISRSNLSVDRTNDVLKLIQDQNDFNVNHEKGGIKKPSSISDDIRVQKIGIYGLEHEDAVNLLKRIEDIYKDVSTSLAGSHTPGRMDAYVLHPEATKQHAVLELSRILGIDRQAIAGIGDSYNDYPLLMASGLKLAMGNAIKDLKDVADDVMPPLEEHGVAAAIDKYFG